MKIKELKDALKNLDDDMDVGVLVAVTDCGPFLGELCEIETISHNGQMLEICVASEALKGKKEYE